jgi:predicted acyl esterase
MEPRVQIGSRVTLDEELPLRGEVDFPLPDTRYTNAYLDGATSKLRLEQPSEAAQTSYDATERGVGAQYDLFFEEDTELTGFMRLHLWIQIDEGNEADLFVEVQKLDRSGEPMPLGPYPFAGPGASAADYPVTRGWLRASYRELDPVRATDFQPAHSYRRREPLTPGEPTAVNVEIWPTSATFRAGEGLRLLVSGKDIGGPQTPQTHNDANSGTHTILTGGEHHSYLVLPVIPLRK